MTPNDGPVATSHRAAVRDREDVVVERLRSLGTAMDGEPDPAFRAATRARLVAMAAVRTPAPAQVSRSVWQRLLAVREDAAPTRWRGRLTAGLAAAALAVTALATVFAVATGARPGDVLYGLKRGTEQTKLALAGDSRGQTLLDFAGTRLTELSGLSGNGDAGLAVSTLRTMDEQTREGAAWLTARAVQTRSAAPVRELSTWTVGQRTGLSAVQPRLPTAARADAGSSLGLLSQIDHRAAALTAALACPSGPATSGTDALGPVPAACPAAPPSAAAGGAGVGTTSAPARGGSATAPTTVPPAGTSTAGGGSTSTGGTGSGGSGTGGTTIVPVPGTGGVVPTPVTTPPVITLPTLPTLPGTPPISTGGSGGSGGGSPAPGLGVCLPPLVQIGSC